MDEEGRLDEFLERAVDCLLPPRLVARLACATRRLLELRVERVERGARLAAMRGRWGAEAKAEAGTRKRLRARTMRTLSRRAEARRARLFWRRCTARRRERETERRAVRRLTRDGVPRRSVAAKSYSSSAGLTTIRSSRQLTVATHRRNRPRNLRGRLEDLEDGLGDGLSRVAFWLMEIGKYFVLAFVLEVEVF